MAKRYISISGNIAVGKSTTSQLLSKSLGYKHFPEPVNNPFLDDYYKDMKRWAFHSQITFALNFAKVHRLITSEDHSVCQERNVYECYVFAKALLKAGILSEREYTTLSSFIDNCLIEFRKPDLIIYLRASIPNLLDRIKKRNIPSEQSINSSYLQELESIYEEWVSEFNVCPIITVDTDASDWLTNPKYLEELQERVLRVLQ